jgi:hypothetical protein
MLGGGDEGGVHGGVQLGVRRLQAQRAAHVPDEFRGEARGVVGDRGVDLGASGAARQQHAVEAALSRVVRVRGLGGSKVVGTLAQPGCVGAGQQLPH